MPFNEKIEIGMNNRDQELRKSVLVIDGTLLHLVDEGCSLVIPPAYYPILMSLSIIGAP